LRRLVDPKAAYLMGGALWYGLGGATASPARAVPYYQRAADGGLVVGKYALGYANAAGVNAEPDGSGGSIAGVPINEAKAKTLLREAALQGNAGAWQVLIDSYREILLIPDDPTRYPSSRATEAIAAIEPRRWLDDQNVYVDPPASVAQSVLKLAPIDEIRALASAGNAKANYVMGRIYIEGLAGQSANFALAVPFLQTAARGGVAEAMYALGWMTQQGVPAADDAHPGITKDALLSKAWFRKSAELGNPSAASM
jgi:TPR repeat protein